MAYNWQSALAGGAGGALSGAGTGALLAGPLGAGLGAIGGGILGGFSGLLNQPQQPQRRNNVIGGQGNPLTGYGSTTEQLPRFSPEQQSALSQLLQQGLSNADFSNIEKQARTQFQTQTVPSIAERFAGLSSGPAGSSRFRGALGAAGAGLEQNLAALRSQYGLQQLGLGLQPTFENIYTPRSEGLLGPVLQAFGSALPSVASYYFSQNQNQNPLANILKNATPEQLQQIMQILGVQ